MIVFFYFITVLEVIELIYSYIRTKKIFTVHTIFFVSIVLNFILYLCNWSSYFAISCQPLTFTIIIVAQILVMFFDFLMLFRTSKDESFVDQSVRLKYFVIGRFKIYPSTVILLITLFLSLIENYIGYGSFFPFLKNVDSHKNTVPIIGTLWRSMYPIGLLSFIYEMKYDKKNVISYMMVVLIFAFLLVGAGSRFWTFINFLTAFLFYFFLNKKKISKRSKIVILISSVLVCSVFIIMGSARLQSGYSYEEAIGYNGPFKGTYFSYIFSWYYGYFPYSFYNLNLTLENIATNNLYTNGQFFIMPFLTTLKLHKIFSIPDYSDLALSVRVITNGSATVATAFFEFYADFQYLFFIPIAFYLFLFYLFERKNALFNKGAYCYFLICWGLFSFYNVISVGIPYTFLLLWFIFCKVFVCKEEENSDINLVDHSS